MSELRTELQSAFVDLGHKRAFDLLLTEVWNSEQSAMGNSTLPTVCDKLNIVAAIHNRKLTESLTNQLKEKDVIIQEIESKTLELQYRLTEQEKRIAALERKASE